MSIDPDTGADPTPVPEGAWPTPGQWVHTFLSLGPDARLATARRVLALAQDLELFDRVFPCDGLCADYPEEDCSRHGRPPRDLWEIIRERSPAAPDGYFTAPDADGNAALWAGSPGDHAPELVLSSRAVENAVWDWLWRCFPPAPPEPLGERLDPHPFQPGQDGSPAHYAGTCAHLTGHGYCAEHRDAAVHQ